MKNKYLFYACIVSLAVAAAPVRDETRMVTRTVELKADYLSVKAGLTKIGSIEIGDNAGYPIVSYRKMVGNVPTPSVVLAATDDGSLNYGDFGYMTHFCYDFEWVSGNGGYLGLTFVDMNGASIWHSIGTVGEGFPISDSQQFFGNGLELARLQKIALSCGNAVYDHSFRIKSLRFEYRPEVLRQQAEVVFNAVGRQSMDHSEKQELAEIIGNVDAAYLPVKGKCFRYVDAIAFNTAVSVSINDAKALLRRINARVLPKATAGSYGVGVADSMETVFLEGPGSAIAPATGMELELAGNEYEGFQVVVAAGAKTLRNVRVSVSALKRGDGASLSAECAVVGHAKTYRETFPIDYVGYYPDFIISYQKSCDVAAHEAVPFWIRVFAPKNASPGIYSGIITVSADGEASWSFPLKARVFSFALPDGTPIPTAWHVNDWQFSRFFNLDKSPRKRELEYAFIDMNCSYRIMYDQIYWAPTVKDYRRDYFEKIKYVDEKYGLKQFSLFSIGLPNKWINDANDKRITDSVDSMLAALDKWKPVCQEFGIWDKAVVYGFDEAKMDSVTQRYYDALKAKAPDLKVMTTARYGDPNLPAVEKLDIWVPLAKRYINRQDLVNANRKAGKKVYWYICDYPRPPEPTFMLGVPAPVPRVFMGLMTAKYRPDGFLYWSNIYWRNPQGQEKYRIINEGPRTDWETRGCHPGDLEEGTLFCPGRDCTALPTIRVENLRDGIEDLWYYFMLAAALENAPADVRLKMSKALEIGEDLVSGSSSYTTDPRQVRAWRRRIAECLEEYIKRKK